MSKSKKGSSFERELCKEFSMWWSDGKRDDIFWRSAGSGGRATNRTKKGKATFGQYGDMQPVDPCGKPLLDLMTIEFKRGYSKTTFADVLDRTDHQGPTQWEQFMEQTIRSAREAGTPYWMLVQRRDKRRAVCFLPWEVWKQLHTLSGEGMPTPACPLFRFRAVLKFSQGKTKRVLVAAVTLRDFFKLVDPIELQKILET